MSGHKPGFYIGACPLRHLLLGRGRGSRVRCGLRRLESCRYHLSGRKLVAGDEEPAAQGLCGVGRPGRSMRRWPFGLSMAAEAEASKCLGP